jgi:hypothetical protein
MPAALTPPSTDAVRQSGRKRIHHRSLSGLGVVARGMVYPQSVAVEHLDRPAACVWGAGTDRSDAELPDVSCE